MKLAQRSSLQCRRIVSNTSKHTTHIYTYTHAHSSLGRVICIYVVDFV